MAGKGLTRIIRFVLDRKSTDDSLKQMERSFYTAAEASGKGFHRELKTQFDKTIADLREKLARGTIDQKAFKEESEKAAKAFNSSLLKSMDDARIKGELTDREYLKLTRTLKKVGEDGSHAGNSLASTFGKVAGVIAGAFALHRIAAFGESLFHTAAEADAIWNRLTGTLELAGIEFSNVSDEIRRNAREMQDTTTVGDEEFATVLTTLVSVSQDYEGSLRNVSLVADLAAARHIDLETAAQLVGKAMVGVTGTLKKYGIVVKEGDDAVETMRKRFKGMAENETRTLAGQVKQLGNEWDDFKEALGRALSQAGGGSSIITTMTQTVKTLAQWIEINTGTFKDWAQTILENMAAVAQFVGLTTGAKSGAASELASIRRQGNAADPNFLRTRHQDLARENAALVTQYDELSAKTQRWGHFVTKAENEQLKGIAERIRQNDVVLGQLRDMALAAASPKPAGGGKGGGGGGGGGGGKPNTGKPAKAAPLAPVPFGLAGAGDPFALMSTDIDFEANESNADKFLSPWQSALDRIAQEVDEKGGLFADLGQAWAEGGLAGLAKLAASKAKQNVAEAIEALARAAGALAFGDFRGAGLFAKQAIGHEAAAIAWRTVGGSIGGGSASHAAGTSGAPGNAGATAANSTQPKATTIIYVDGFNSKNPVHVKTFAEGIKAAGLVDSSIDVRPRNSAP